MSVVCASIENSPVHLKDRLIADIDSTYDMGPEDAALTLNKVLVVLDYTEELFVALDYGYKTRELAERVMNAIPRQLDKLGPRAERLPRVYAKLNKWASDLRYR